MNSSFTRSLFILLPILALGLTIASEAEARNINVNCPMKSLQTAVDRANPGDTLNVSGTCNELIVVGTDGVTIDGGGAATIDGDTPAPVGGTKALLRVFASDVTIRDITVQDSPGIGITIRRSGSATIRGTIVQNNIRHGISVSRSGHARIGASSGEHDNPPTAGSEGNIIQLNGQHGIIVRLSAGARIFHNNILGNTLSGIRLAECGSADIDGNNITGNTDRGIFLSTNASVRLSDAVQHGEANLIAENTQGVRCRLGGALRGDPQDFGTGNPGSGDHTDDTDISGSCPVATSLGF